MASALTLAKGLPLLAAAGALAVNVYMPPIPADLTTPVQQRIAIHGENGESTCAPPA